MFFPHGSTALMGLGILYDVPWSQLVGHTHTHIHIHIHIL